MPVQHEKAKRRPFALAGGVALALVKIVVRALALSRHRKPETAGPFKTLLWPDRAGEQTFPRKNYPVRPA